MDKQALARLRDAYESTDAGVVDELYLLAHKRGITPQKAKEAIEKAVEPKKLLRRWRRAHAAEERRILLEQRKREDDARAEDARDRHATFMERQLQRREFARKQMRLGMRLDVAIREAECISGVSSSMTGATKINAPGGDSVMLLALPLEDLETHLFVIRARLSMIEHDLDHAHGCRPARGTQLSTQEKDATIIAPEMRGISPEAISEAYPWLGSPLTIRRVRRMHGLYSRDGRPNPKSVNAKVA